MIDNELHLKLQAHLDGELPRAEAREVEERLAADAEARALLGELTATVEALAGAEAGVRLPESREFFWSKIEAQIQRESRRDAVPATTSFWTGWQPWRILPTPGLLPTAILPIIRLWFGSPIPPKMSWLITTRRIQWTSQ